MLLTIQSKTRALDDVSRKIRDRDGELEEQLRQKEEELEIYKTGMDSTLLQLKELQLVIVICQDTNGRRTMTAIKRWILRLTISSKSTSRNLIISLVDIPYEPNLIT